MAKREECRVHQSAYAGGHPKLVQQLARQCDIELTMNRYSHSLQEDEAVVLNVLPSFPSVSDGNRPPRQALQATGTEDAAPTVLTHAESVLPICLPNLAAIPCGSVRSDVDMSSGESSTADK